MDVEVLSLENLTEAQDAISKISVNPIGIKIMALKAVFKAVKIKNVDARTANIMKQEMLSRGGDIAVSRDVGSFRAETTDILILGTLAQHIRLIKKLEHQTFRDCKKLSKILQDTLFGDVDINMAEVW